MKKSIPTPLLAALLVFPVVSIAAASTDSVTGSNQMPKGGCENKNVYTPGLGEIMSATQMRHTKLWFAGKAGNWKLAEYELYELKEGFDNAIKFHPKRSESLLKITEYPLKQLKTSISKKNNMRFIHAFEVLTNSCNTCHKASNFEFNVVIIPAANPYTNQDFEVSN